MEKYIHLQFDQMVGDNSSAPFQNRRITLVYKKVEKKKIKEIAHWPSTGPKDCM